MDYQLDYYKQIYKDHIEFHTFDAPYKVEKVWDQALKDRFKGPFYGWYIYDEKTKERKGFMKGIAYIINYINEHGPFDGLLGFSQGSIICRIILKKAFFTAKIPEIQDPEPNFAVFFSSVVPIVNNTSVKAIQTVLSEDYTQPIFF